MMKIRLHFTVVFTLLVFIFTGYYLEFLILMGTIIAHELAHVAASLLYRQRILRLNLTLVGGMLDIDLKTHSMFRKLAVYMAGILLNVLFLLLSEKIPDPYYRQLVYQYNLLLIVFNILPIYPLDGFHILEVFLSHMRDPFREQKILSFISFLFLAGLMVFVILFTTSLAFWAIGFYLLYQNITYSTNRKQMALQRIVKNYRYS
jgi:stage IV sporulation protein FB